MVIEGPASPFGNVLTITVTASVDEHPCEFETVTVYVVVKEGETFIEEEVLAVFHVYKVPPLALSVT